MAKYPKDLDQLIALFKKFPGVGAKTAERFAFHFLHWKKEEQPLFGSVIENIQKNISKCPSCGALTDQLHCFFCSSSQRNREIVCVVSSERDIFSIEETKTYQGMYYVLKCLLSPLEGRNIEDLDIAHFYDFLQKMQAKEILLALDFTLEGDTTSLFLKKQLEGWGVAVTRLAFGLPLGSSLEYIDSGTLARALLGKQTFS